jgi:adenine deaminase
VGCWRRKRSWDFVRRDFGGYIADNYRAVGEALSLTRVEIVQLAENAVEASFQPELAKAGLVKRMHQVAASVG